MNNFVTTRRRAAFAAVLGASSISLSVGLSAEAQTPANVPSPATASFCAQLRASQAMLAASKVTGAAQYKLVAGEWAKISSAAPVKIKTDVAAIESAYAKAAGAPATATAVLKTLGASSKAVTEFSAQNCQSDGSGQRRRFDPTDPANKAFVDCVAKQGVTLGSGRGGGQGGGGQGGDPKRQAAIQACQSKLPAGTVFRGGGGGGGFGGVLNNPQMQACLKSKGVTVPTRPAGPANGQAPNNSAPNGSAPNGSAPNNSTQAGTDPKFRTALDACRTQLGLGARGTGQGNAATPVAAGAKP